MPSVIHRFFILLVAVAALEGTCRGDLIIDIQDATLNPAGTGFVDVLISSTSSDTFNGFGFEIHITPVGGALGALTFQDPQSNSDQSDGSYIFAGDTDPFNYDVAYFVDNPPSNDILFGGDFTDSGNDITLTSGDGTRLLGRLDLEHIYAGLPSLAVGSQFTLSVQNTVDTAFLDSAFAEATIDPTSFGALGDGIITINSTAAVPEPSSLALLSLGMAGYGVYRRRKRERQKVSGTVY